MRITSDNPATKGLLISAPRRSTWGRGPDAATKVDPETGVPLVGAFVMLMGGGSALRRWVEWPSADVPAPPELPLLVTLDGLSVDLYDRKTGEAGVSITAASVVPVG